MSKKAPASVSTGVITRIDADGNASITLNRPEVHNALDAVTTRELTAALEKLDADAKVQIGRAHV